MECEFNIKDNPHEEFLLGLRKGINNIVVTTKCNINCCFCSRLFNPFKTEMYHREFNEIIAEINACWPNKMKMINSSISRMTDGEPFTHPRVWDILKHVRARFPFKGLTWLHDKIQITTNGTYLDEDNLRKLAELQGVVLVHSINTTNLDDWIKLTGSSRSLGRTVVSVPELIKELDIEYLPSIVAMPAVVGYEGVEETLRDLSRQSVKSVRVFVPTYTRFASPEQQKMLSCDGSKLHALVKRLRRETDMDIWLYPEMHTDLEPRLTGFEGLGLTPKDTIISVNDRKPFSRTQALNYLLYGKETKKVTIKNRPLKKLEVNPKDVRFNNYIYDRINKDTFLTPSMLERAIGDNKTVLIMHSEAGADIIKKAINKAVNWSDNLNKKDFFLQKVYNDYYGGNVKCAGLLMCSDYRKYLTEFISSHFKPDLVLVSKDSFDVLGRDLLKNSIYDVFDEMNIAFNMLEDERGSSYFGRYSS